MFFLDVSRHSVDVKRINEFRDSVKVEKMNRRKLSSSLPNFSIGRYY